VEAPVTWRSKRFEATRRLGAGGFGVVHAVRDLERGGVVALKSLSRLDPRGLLRFKREFRALADIDHPNLVAPFELLEEGGEWFFTMPLVDGVDLLTWVRGRGPEMIPTASTVRLRIDSLTTTLDADGTISTGGPEGVVIAGTPAPLIKRERLLGAMPQLAEGVGALHRHGLIHRDLKPSNVLVDVEGVIRILDFGLVADRAEKGDSVLGTPAYMSPEQARGKPVDEATDWYAVGVMLYECLTGVLPFEGTLLQMIVAKQTRDAPRAKEHIASIDEDLDSLCAALLSRDPDARPRGPELLRRLGTPAAIGVSLRAPARDLLVGRDVELEALRAALAEAEAGSFGVIRIEGASGTGKSVLVGHFARGLSSRAHVLTGRCYEQERVPYLALDGVVDAMVPLLEAMHASLPANLPDLARIFPVLGGLTDEGIATSAQSPQEARRQAASALRDALGALCRDSPLVVHIDDAQWGDSDSAALLVELLSAGPIPGVLFILAHRSESGSGGPFLSLLAQADVIADAQTISLGPLGEVDAERLALAVLDGDDEDSRARARAIVAEAGGHAMFVQELAHHTSDSERPASLDEMIDTRVAKLDPPSRALLEMVAVAGAPLPREVFEHAAGVGDASVATERALRAGRFVRATGRRGDRSLSPYHDRIREVTLARLGDDVRRRHHLALANVLEHREDADAELLSRHLHSGEAHERAIPYTLAAAERASGALAFDRAVALHRRAVLHTPAEDPARVSRLVALADALAEAGHGTEAATTFMQAAEHVEPQEGTTLRRRAVEQWIRAGRIDEGLGALDEILRDLSLPTRATSSSALFGLVAESMRLSFSEPRGTPSSESEIDPMTLTRIDTLFSVGTALSLVEPIRGMAFTRHASRLSYRVNEPSRVMRAFVQRAIHESAKGSRGLPRASAHISRAREIAASLGDDVSVAVISLGEAYVMFLSGHFRRAADLVHEAEPVLNERATYKWELDASRRGALKGQTFTGELADMRSRAAPLLADAIACGDLFSQVGLSIRFMYLVALMNDDAELAQTTIDGAMARWSGRKPFLQHWLDAMARVEVSLYRGDAKLALSDLEERWPAIVKMRILWGQYGGIESRHMRGRAALAAGELGLAEKMAGRLDREHAPYARALARGLRAGALAPTDGAASREAFEDAGRLMDEADLPLYAAAARARAGERTLGLPGQALIEDAHQQLRAEGIRRPEAFIDLYAPVPITG